jgi:hypothetical protein
MINRQRPSRRVQDPASPVLAVPPSRMTWCGDKGKLSEICDDKFLSLFARMHSQSLELWICLIRSILDTIPWKFFLSDSLVNS